MAGVAAAAWLGLTPLGTETANAATASASSLGSYLYAGQTMQQGQYLISSNGQYRLIMQGNGNLVEYIQGHALWSSRTSGHGAYAVMQGDGNLVVYQGSTPLWGSSTGGTPAPPTTWPCSPTPTSSSKLRPAHHPGPPTRCRTACGPTKP